MGTVKCDHHIGEEDRVSLKSDTKAFIVLFSSLGRYVPWLDRLCLFLFVGCVCCVCVLACLPACLLTWRKLRFKMRWNLFLLCTYVQFGFFVANGSPTSLLGPAFRLFCCSTAFRFLGCQWLSECVVVQAFPIPCCQRISDVLVVNGCPTPLLSTDL